MELGTQRQGEDERAYKVVDVYLVGLVLAIILLVLLRFGFGFGFGMFWL